MTIKRNLINEQVYQYIKDKIIKDELKPNEKIDVQKMAEELGVSKTPVTLALTRLQTDGFVTILPQSGTFVRSHSLEELSVIYQCRACLEKQIVEIYGPTYNKEYLREIRNEFSSINDIAETNEAQDQLFALELKFHDSPLSPI